MAGTFDKDEHLNWGNSVTLVLMDIGRFTGCMQLKV